MTILLSAILNRFFICVWRHNQGKAKTSVSHTFTYVNLKLDFCGCFFSCFGQESFCLLGYWDESFCLHGYWHKSFCLLGYWNKSFCLLGYWHGSFCLPLTLHTFTYVRQRLNTAINWVDFVSLWMWFNASPFNRINQIRSYLVIPAHIVPWPKLSTLVQP